MRVVMESVIKIGCDEPVVNFVRWGDTGILHGYLLTDPFGFPTFTQKENETDREFKERVDLELSNK